MFILPPNGKQFPQVIHLSKGEDVICRHPYYLRRVIIQIENQAMFLACVEVYQELPQLPALTIPPAEILSHDELRSRIDPSDYFAIIEAARGEVCA